MRTLELRTVDGRCVARRVHMACSFRSRCLGLLLRRSIPEDEGLLLLPGGSVHTLGMAFPVDVVFLTAQMRVLEMAPRVAPWRIAIAPKRTARVLELAAGRIETTRLAVGTYLIVERASDDPPTIKLPLARHTPCERFPVRFSLRIPAPRSPQPCRPARDARATTPPSAET